MGLWLSLKSSSHSRRAYAADGRPIPRWGTTDSNRRVRVAGAPFGPSRTVFLLVVPRGQHSGKIVYDNGPLSKAKALL